MTEKTERRPLLARNSDIFNANIVSNDTTLARRVKDNEFPKGFLLGPSTRVRTWEEIDLWLQWRASGEGVSFADWLIQQGKADRLSASGNWHPRRAAGANDD